MVIVIGIAIVALEVVIIRLSLRRIRDFGKFSSRHSADMRQVVDLSEVSADRSTRALLLAQQVHQQSFPNAHAPSSSRPEVA